MDVIHQKKETTLIDSTLTVDTGHDLILDEVNEVTAESSEKTIMTYDEGHHQLQKVMDELYKHAEELADLVPVNGKGDYIGYIYSTENLYSYLLAIYYKGEDILDPSYPYKFSYDSFDELTKTYHEYVDFKSIELEKMKHTEFDIEIVLSYQNKITHSKEFLRYYLSYSSHELKDLTDFY